MHRYGPGRDQHGDLWLPVGAGPWPVAVVLHGGFWKDRYRKGLMDRVCADLVRRGWAAWNLEYRRVGGGGGWPATLEDVAAGVDLLADLARSAPLDLSCVVTVGHSAGGQLALWVAGRADSRVAVAGVVGLAPVSDLVEADRLGLGGHATRRFLGGPAARVPERYAAASPAARLPLGIPQLLVHGVEDDTVPVSMSAGYAAAASRAGDDVEVVVVPGIGHMEVIDPRETEAWGAVTGWLQSRR